jgi:hypothetical protein
MTVVLTSLSAVVLVTSILAGPALVSASTAEVKMTGQDVIAEAKEDFERGKQALLDGRFTDALTEFAQAIAADVA